MIRNSTAALIAALTLASTPAPAANFDGISVAELVGVFQSAGVSVSATSKADIIQAGASFVWLTDCQSNGRCAEICIFRNYGDVHPTMQAVNEWNNSKKIPEASLNSDGTLHMEMWISAIGTTDRNIVDTFGWFERYAADTDYWGPYISAAGV
jgi:hypothetical protein